MKQGRVIKSYITPYPDPLKLKKGDVIKIDRAKTSEWPGWIWGTTGKGKSVWFPQSYLRIENNEAVLLRDYDATELSVEIGVILLILDTEAGWYWCKTDSGKSGWVPAENLKIIEE